MFNLYIDPSCSVLCSKKQRVCKFWNPSAALDPGCTFFLPPRVSSNCRSAFSLSCSCTAVMLTRQSRSLATAVSLNKYFPCHLVPCACQPTRSLGDAYLKYPEFNGQEDTHKSAGRFLPPPYTPPYIIAEPEVRIRTAV